MVRTRIPRDEQIWRIAVEMYTEYQVKAAIRKMPANTADSDAGPDPFVTVSRQDHGTVASPPEELRPTQAVAAASSAVAAMGSGRGSLHICASIS